MSIKSALEQPFGTIAELIRDHAVTRPGHVALVQDDRQVTFAELNELMDRVAAALARDGVRPREVAAVCAANSIEYALVFLGALRAGVAVAPLAPSTSAAGLASMVRDCAARLLFVDAAAAERLGALSPDAAPALVALDGRAAGQPLAQWLGPAPARLEPVAVQPDWPFNIIYSSGTTGTPKGIVQPHSMRWVQTQRGHVFGYGPDAVTLVSTPLYSNTTLVSFLPTVALGGTTVLMDKFDATRFLQLAERHRVTHAMLVPVQYQRLMQHADFDKFDLSSFRMKFCTSAPFAAALKSDVLARWPGGLVEYYGMTEGGGTCMLIAHERPDKLHTVGRPAEGHDIRLIDEHGREVPPGHAGEVVGRSGAMMTGYFNQPEKTAEAEWHDPQGQRFIRTGDVGRFDEEGFLTLLDRKKDMVISGGFNIYPSDLEAVLARHEAVAEVAVVGVPSERWGETPVAFVVLREQRTERADALRDWANAQLGNTQRLAAVELVDALPRSAIGKVLKRELRERLQPGSVA